MIHELSHLFGFCADNMLHIDLMDIIIMQKEIEVKYILLHLGFLFKKSVYQYSIDNNNKI
jgi:hypothetical protein